ncbi:50S ribosomal protein L17-like [Salvia splendens]|uniref:50S ribosomal protein L17-like n=1 Tax=Salvia splendens TaxID=180675 RepID=UPI001C25B197|nr:50S ribosomal protein L17-like [Salvia splendens]
MEQIKEDEMESNDCNCRSWEKARFSLKLNECGRNRAKEARRLADNMVQLGKEVSLCAARRAGAFVGGDDVIHKLYTELAYRHKHRAGGYTRMLRTRIRVGDAAPMAYIEFIDRENELRQSKPPTPPPPQRPTVDPWTRSRLTRQYAPSKEEKISDSDS